MYPYETVFPFKPEPQDLDLQQSVVQAKNDIPLDYDDDNVYAELRKTKRIRTTITPHQYYDDNGEDSSLIVKPCSCHPDVYLPDGHRDHNRLEIPQELSISSSSFYFEPFNSKNTFMMKPMNLPYRPAPAPPCMPPPTIQSIRIKPRMLTPTPEKPSTDQLKTFNGDYYTDYENETTKFTDSIPLDINSKSSVRRNWTSFKFQKKRKNRSKIISIDHSNSYKEKLANMTKDKFLGLEDDGVGGFDDDDDDQGDDDVVVVHLGKNHLKNSKHDNYNYKNNVAKSESHIQMLHLCFRMWLVILIALLAILGIVTVLYYIVSEYNIMVSQQYFLNQANQPQSTTIDHVETTTEAAFFNDSTIL